jgi:hypothetical protein
MEKYPILENRIHTFIEKNPFLSIEKTNIFLEVLQKFNKMQKTEVYSCAIVDKTIDKNISWSDIGGFQYMFALEEWNDYLIKEYTQIRNKEKKRKILSKEENEYKYTILQFLLLNDVVC